MARLTTIQEALSDEAAMKKALKSAEKKANTTVGIVRKAIKLPLTQKERTI